MPPADEPNSLPPVVPDEADEPSLVPSLASDAEAPNSLPPVVPEEAHEPSSVPSLASDAEVPNSLPPVVPDEPDPGEPSSVPQVLPDGAEPADEPSPLPSVASETEAPNSLPPVVPDEPDPGEPNSLPPVVPDEDGPADLDSAPPDKLEADALPPPAVLDEAQTEEMAPPAADAPGDRAARPQDVRIFVAPDDASDVQDVTEGDVPTAEAAASSPSGWAVLRRALAPRATRAQIVAGVLCAVLGFAVVAQVRQSGETDLAGMRQGDLVRILDETTNRSDALAREAADLARERDDLLSGSDRRQAALDALRRSAETQGILAGRLPAEGPGVIVTLTEPDRFIKPNTMLNMLEEMRNAGAEAIQLNGQRITASSAFTGTGGAVVLDGVELSAPYRWIAIGDPDAIAPALQIPGGAMAQVRNSGGKGTVDQLDLVQVDAVRIVPEPVYATPVPPQGD
ncbi:DUF881 domain-containing protein [Cellulomonas xylanilytica]|uniref:DUF881 domain-containing protein n=1 Tax=Cellulomonas xylanilytica TaxID=233583 RepID=A0A510UZM5_9CELL|nr:DUF881 domain-containing protein [Cellulomonas xylanilytica]GEK20039.1 hypothetical protein CXY01_05590 [Cellulomonas xylanilytica]